MNAYEMQMIAKMVAEEVYNRLACDEKFMKKVSKHSKKSRMLNTRQVSELLGISTYTVRDIAEALGGIKANAKGDTRNSKRYGHLSFKEEGLVERYEAYLRTK